MTKEEQCKAAVTLVLYTAGCNPNKLAEPGSFESLAASKRSGRSNMASAGVKNDLEMA